MSDSIISVLRKLAKSSMTISTAKGDKMIHPSTAAALIRQGLAEIVKTNRVLRIIKITEAGREALKK